MGQFRFRREVGSGERERRTHVVALLLLGRSLLLEKKSIIEVKSASDGHFRRRRKGESMSEEQGDKTRQDDQPFAYLQPQPSWSSWEVHESTEEANERNMVSSDPICQNQKCERKAKRELTELASEADSAASDSSSEDSCFLMSDFCKRRYVE